MKIFIAAQLQEKRKIMTTIINGYNEQKTVIKYI